MSQIASALPIAQTIRVSRARGATFEMTVKDDAGTVEDLTDDTITCQVYDAYGGTLKFAATCSITAPQTAGIVTISMTATQTDDGLSGEAITRWVYVIDRTHSGVITPLFQGPFEIHPVVTE